MGFEQPIVSSFIWYCHVNNNRLKSAIVTFPYPWSPTGSPAKLFLLCAKARKVFTIQSSHLREASGSKMSDAWYSTEWSFRSPLSITRPLSCTSPKWWVADRFRFTDSWFLANQSWQHLFVVRLSTLFSTLTRCLQMRRKLSHRNWQTTMSDWSCTWRKEDCRKRELFVSIKPRIKERKRWMARRLKRVGCIEEPHHFLLI